ncbi:protein DYAD-like, partial [Trifolium medium]|nr:protein DYAD-like [Trifolium medium]
INAKKFKEEDLVLLFLTGLNDHYAMVISQILLIKPFPQLNSASGMVIEHESLNSLDNLDDSVSAAVNLAKQSYGKNNFPKTDKKCTYCHKTNHIVDNCFRAWISIKTLCRSITAEEFALKRNSWSFWASPTNTPVINDDATRLVSKQGSCWSQLKFTGMMQWGQRRQVRFLGHHEDQKAESLCEPHKEKGVVKNWTYSVTP